MKQDRRSGEMGAPPAALGDRDVRLVGSAARERAGLSQTPRASQIVFDGDFWLCWLLPGSQVLSAGDGSGAAVVVNAKGIERRIDIGETFEVPL